MMSDKREAAASFVQSTMGYAVDQAGEALDLLREFETFEPDMPGAGKTLKALREAQDFLAEAADGLDAALKPFEDGTYKVNEEEEEDED